MEEGGFRGASETGGWLTLRLSRDVGLSLLLMVTLSVQTQQADSDKEAEFGGQSLLIC